MDSSAFLIVMELHYKNFRISMDFGFPAMLAIAFLQSEQDFMKQMLLVSLVHELGHGLVMCLTGAGIREIRFHASGIRMLTNHWMLHAGQAFWIYLSGPLVNLLCAWIFWSSAPEMAILHLCMGIFNLLPYRILDGGSLLRYFLEHQPDALRIVRLFCVILSVVAICAGYFFAIYNPVWYLMAIYLAISEFFC
ncbi:MAG: site-2 protease family protein [Oscillospiraceae bacterium]|nr:site-2 protease family protein [Oscillospiraceae bacterium]